jgi:hypothetical protein
MHPFCNLQSRARIFFGTASLGSNQRLFASPLAGSIKVKKLQNGCIQLAAATDKVYQMPAHGRWFSPGTPVSSTTKTGRHDIAEMCSCELNASVL